MVNYFKILQNQLQKLKQNINQMLDPQKTCHNSPIRASYGMSFVNICEKIDDVVMAPHFVLCSITMSKPETERTTYILPSITSWRKPKVFWRKLNLWFDHDDNIIKWKHFPYYWPFVRGIHQSPVDPSHKGHWHRGLMFPLICATKKQLSKQSKLIEHSFISNCINGPVQVCVSSSALVLVIP